MKPLYRLLSVSAVLSLAAAPSAALAADDVATAASKGVLMALLSDPEVITLAVSALVGGGIALYRSWKKDKAETHLRWLGQATSIAYYSVNDIALRTANKIDDKVAKALGYFRDELARRGYVPTAKEEEDATARWKAMHGAELTAAKLAAEGAGAVAATAAVTAVQSIVPASEAIHPSRPRG